MSDLESNLPNTSASPQTEVKPNMLAGCARTLKCQGERPHSSGGHMSTSTGDKPYLCGECGRTFSLAGILKRHMLIHTGERPHICAKCGRAFGRYGDLKSHMIIHTGEMPYQCGVCVKTFRRLSNVKKHMLIHTNVKPYRCGVCFNTFGRRDSLNQHILVKNVNKITNVWCVENLSYAPVIKTG